jgi:hypothetical protein
MAPLTLADVEFMQESLRRMKFENARWGRSGFVRF